MSNGTGPSFREFTSSPGQLWKNKRLFFVEPSSYSPFRAWLPSCLMSLVSPFVHSEEFSPGGCSRFHRIRPSLKAMTPEFYFNPAKIRKGAEIFSPTGQHFPFLQLCNMNISETPTATLDFSWRYSSSFIIPRYVRRNPERYCMNFRNVVQPNPRI